MIASCPVCHRRERWDGGERHVEMEGGRRNPPVHPVLQAWRTCREAREAGRVVVGRCVCGQPLVAEAGTWMPWTLDTPKGPVVVRADGQSEAGGEIETERLDARLYAGLGPKIEIKPGLFVFQSTMMLSIVAPALLWLAALFVVIVFLIGFGSKPGF
ncbi:MAG: hypothetical protein H6737_01455 [Alphaproteobacteria bacterium]|nr:hypothetical protein [Alphaproteobacteria bacterium]